MKKILLFLSKYKFEIISIFIYFLFVYCFCAPKITPSLPFLKLDNIKTLCEILAIIFGGIWTYTIFIKNRVDYPSAKIFQEITHWEIDKDHVCLSVIDSVTNTGKVVIRLNYCKVLVQQILPISNELKSSINRIDKDDIQNGIGESVFYDTESLIAWPKIGCRKIEWEKEKTVIEPGESEEFQYEFILYEPIQKVRVISYYRNSKLPEIGWRKTNLYDIGSKNGNI